MFHLFEREFNIIETGKNKVDTNGNFGQSNQSKIPGQFYLHKLHKSYYYFLETKSVSFGSLTKYIPSAIASMLHFTTYYQIKTECTDYDSNLTLNLCG